MNIKILRHIWLWVFLCPQDFAAMEHHPLGIGATSRLLPLYHADTSGKCAHSDEILLLEDKNQGNRYRILPVIMLRDEGLYGAVLKRNDRFGSRHPSYVAFIATLLLLFITDSGIADSSGANGDALQSTKNTNQADQPVDGSGKVSRACNTLKSMLETADNTYSANTCRDADNSAGRISVPETNGIAIPGHQYKPHQSLYANASQRKDELTGKALWDDGQEWSLQKKLGLPSWLSLTLEGRVRYENYGTPWMKGDTTGQYAVPLQTVLWAEARLNEAFRIGAEFWDARQYGPSDPNYLDDGMSNAANFAQIYAAHIGRNIFDSGLDTEVKGGQMTMDVGSRRLIARYHFRNSTNQFVGLQTRLHDSGNGWELMAFANSPEQLLPVSTSQLLHNDIVWNRPQTDAFFTGALLTKSLPWQSSAELYLYYLHEGPNNPLNRSLYAPGLRVKRHKGRGGVDFEIESIGQAGTARISPVAPVLDFGGILQHVEFGYTFDMPWNPRFVAEWDYASSHFDPLYGTTVPDFGPTGILWLFNRINIDSPAYRFVLAPYRDFTVTATNRFWWLADNKSTLGWSQANLVDTTGSSGSYVGQSWELNGRWDAFDNVAFQIGWQVLMKGGFARNAPGAPVNHNNVNYYFLATEFRF
jgi:hypothetical protein